MRGVSQNSASLLALLCFGAFAACGHSESEVTPVKYGLGEAASPQYVSSLARTIPPSGKGLPPGTGNAVDGRGIYDAQCSACHGIDMNGRAGLGPALIGGRGSLATNNPKKTVESYWPYATTLFTYVRNTMPPNAPGSLSDEETYSVLAIILTEANIISEDEVLDQHSLPNISMPNVNGFVTAKYLAEQ